MKLRSSQSAVLLFIFAALIAMPAHEAKAMTLHEAIETALENNLGLKSLKSESSSAEHMSDAAKASLMPELMISERYSRTNNPMYVFGGKLNQERVSQADFDPAKLNNPEALDNYQTSISLRMPLYAGGGLRAQIGKAKSAVNASDGNLSKARQELTAMVIKAWLGLNLLKERELVLSEHRRVAEANLAKTNDKVELGMALEPEALDMTIERDRTTQQLNETAVAIKTTLSQLKLLLGLSNGSSFEPVFGAYDAGQTAASLESVISEALGGRPEIKIINQQIEMAGHDREIAKAGYLPEVSLVGDYSLNQERLGNADGDSWQLGIVASWNIFSGGKDRAKVRAAASRLNGLTLRKESLKQEIENEVERAYYELETIRNNLSISKKRIALAEESLRITRERYEQGLATGANILASETQYKEARLNYLESRNQELAASSSLDLAIGRNTTSIMEIGR